MICSIVPALIGNKEGPRLVIVARSRTALAAARRELHGSVGLVATMGALHPGHLALLRAARRECDAVIATLFVNPTQFAPDEDFRSYPRDEAADLAAFDVAGADLVFAPPAAEVYPEGFATVVDPGSLGTILEGASRPGHFAGVATVVAKLLNLTGPDRAYFGQKDWQQTRVVRRIVTDLNLPVRIVVVRTERERDGLAWSSRNVELDAAARPTAACLWSALRTASSAWDEGERDVASLERLLAAPIESEPLAELDYAVVRHAETIEPVASASAPIAFLVAARVGGVRLIDNEVRGAGLVDAAGGAPR